jgi:hypothetical protein
LVRRAFIILACVGGVLLTGAAALPAVSATRAKPRVVYFRLIVEGTSTAERTFDVSGKEALCNIQAHGTVTEKATYLRGRGVTFAVQRTQKGWSFTRAFTHTDITTVVTIQRKAHGPVTITPTYPNIPTSVTVCQTLANNLKKQLKGTTDIANAHCPQKWGTREDWGFKFEGNSFALDNLGNDNHAPTVSGDCGYTTYTEGFLDLTHEFPDIPKVAFVPSPFPPVCTVRQPCFEDFQIWAHHHAVLIHMTSGEVTDPQQNVGNPLFGLSGHATDSGRTDVLLRFIRQP